MIRLLFAILVISNFQAEAQEVSAFSVADSLVQIGSYTKAIAIYEQQYNKPLANQKIAQAFEQLGQPSKALEYYERVLQEQPNNFRSQYKYGLLLRTLNKYKKADSLFTELRAKHPQNASVLYQLGYAKEQLKDSTATIYYSMAYQVDKNQQNALYRLAKILLEKRQFTMAKTYIDKGLEAQPESTRFLLLDALSYFVNKSYHDAIKQYERLLELGKDTEQIRSQLAQSYAQTNNFEKAVTAYSHLINTYDDQNSNWHFNLGKCFLTLGDYEKARRHISIAIGLLDVPLDSHFVNMAISYNREGNFKEVIKNLKLALKENPKNSRAQYQLAVAYDNYLEDKETVLKHYQEYLKHFPEQSHYRELVQMRISDLRKELHLDKD